MPSAFPMGRSLTVFPASIVIPIRPDGSLRPTRTVQSNGEKAGNNAACSVETLIKQKPQCGCLVPDIQKAPRSSFKNIYTRALACAAQSVGASSHARKDCWLDSQSGHTPRLWFDPQWVHIWEGGYRSMLLSYIDTSLSLSFLPCPFSKTISKT